jgi:hypothetical protein
MQHAYIDISRGLDGQPVVLACFDLREDEVAAAARAVAAIAAERYRTPRISADDVLELREMTALADELEHGAPADAARRDEPGPGVGPGEGSQLGHGAEAGHGTEPAQGAEPGHGTEPGQGTEPRQGTDPGHGTEPGQGTEPGHGIRTMVFQPARLCALRDAVAAFVDSRDDAEWVGHEDRGPHSLLRGLVLPLEQLCADAMRAALSPDSYAR